MINTAQSNMEIDSLTQRQFIEFFVDKCHCQSEGLSSCPLSKLRQTNDEVERKKQIAQLSDDEVESLHQHIVLCITGGCDTKIRSSG